MTQSEITAEDMATLLTATIPLASTDATLAVLNGVMIERVDGYWTARATNRYVAGIMRTKAEGDAPEGGLSFEMSTADAKDLLKLCKALKYAVLPVSVDDGHVSFPMLGRTYVDMLKDYTFPKIGSLIANMAKAAPALDAPFGVDPALVAKFGPVQKATRDALTFYAHVEGGYAPKFAVTCGPDFIGAFMGIRHGTGIPSAPDTSSWDALLAS